MKIAFLLSCCFLSLAAHQLKYNSTFVESGKTFTAVVELDGQQILHWDSNNMTMVPDIEWIKKVSVLEKNHWNKETEFMKQEKGDLELFLGKIKEFLNQHGNHSLSQIHGCQTNDKNENGSGFKWYSYDQKEFLRLNLTSITWIPADDKAQKYLIDKGWDSTKAEANAWKKRLEGDCIDNLKLYAKYNSRQVSPEVHVYHQPSLSLELVCNATGFIPKEVDMSWEKDGEKVKKEDVEVRETLPNQDESFQKRIILRVSPEDLQKNKYTCVIQHSSLKEELRVDLEVPDNKVSTGLIISTVMAVVLLVVVVVVVVGMVVWKKKIFGYRLVSSGSDTERL